MTTRPASRGISRDQAIFSWISVIMCSMFMFRGSAGLVLRPCDQSGNVELVVDNTDFSFTCEEYSGGNVVWYYWSYNKTRQIIGTCGPSSCAPNDIIPIGLFILSPLTQASSRLTLTNMTTNRQFGGTYIYCGTNLRCQVDIVSPAVLPANSLKFTASQWNLQGSTDVTSVYSSLGRYSCEWTETNQAGEKTSISGVTLSLAPDTSDTSVTQSRAGQCSFSKKLPSDPGTYTYTVAINPGNTQRTGGTRTIVRPESPTVDCNPTGHVPENKDLSCTCRATNVGQPNGRLVWVRGSDVNSPINAGIYGATNLVMTPQSLIRGDHNRTYFHCDVEWIQNVSGQTCTVLVGYGPSQPTFTPSNVTVEENQTLSFNCTADGRPTPSITLIHQDSGAELLSQSPYIWRVSPCQCKDGGVYSCSASNAMGPDTQTNVTVYVMCAPQELNSGFSNRPILNFQDAPLSHVFNMTAYPTPTSFNVTFVGLDMTFTSPEQKITGINVNVSCQQRSRPLYIATCTLIVNNVTSAKAAGFYRLTLTNEKGSGDFVFQVKINATEDGSGAPDVNAGAVAGGVVAAVVVVIVVVILVVITRRKQGTDGDGGEGETDEYAVVNKVPVAACAQSPDTYALVNKGKKTAQTGRTPDKKAKTSMPDKQQNRNFEHSAAGNTDHEYSNMALSMVSLTNKADTISDDKHSKQTAGGGGRQTNKDGPTYTTVDFTGPAGQQSAQSAPPPAAQSVLYSEVVFNQATPTQ